MALCDWTVGEDLFDGTMAGIRVWLPARAGCSNRHGQFTEKRMQFSWRGAAVIMIACVINLDE